MFHSLNHSLSLSLSLTHSLTYTLTHSHSINYTINQSPTHPFIHSPTHSLNHSLTHSLTDLSLLVFCEPPGAQRVDLVLLAELFVEPLALLLLEAAPWMRLPVQLLVRLSGSEAGSEAGRQADRTHSSGARGNHHKHCPLSLFLYQPFSLAHTQ